MTMRVKHLPIVIGLLALSALACSGYDVDVYTANQKAKQYASDNYPGWEVVNAKCEQNDSDMNGMVRCNLSVKNPENGDISTPAIECPYEEYTGGCDGASHAMCETPKSVSY